MWKGPNSPPHFPGYPEVVSPSSVGVRLPGITFKSPRPQAIGNGFPSIQLLWKHVGPWLMGLGILEGLPVMGRKADSCFTVSRRL